jgi:hypothetical protein
VNQPRHVAIGVSLDVGNDGFRNKRFGRIPLDEQRERREIMARRYDCAAVTWRHGQSL